MSVKKAIGAAALALAAIAAAGCGGTPSAGSSSVSQVQNVKTSGFGSLGNVNLTVWSYDNQDPGLEPVLKTLSANFEKQYPNVHINLVFKDFNSLVNVVARSLASGSGPDITEGNQGFQTDAQLVKAGLILPLNSYANAYGWNKWYSPGTWSTFRWSRSGKEFGQGPIWGVAQTGQNVNIYANTQKLKQLGFDPNNMPTTFAGFNSMLAQIRQKLPSSQPVIEEGNQEGYGFIHMFGGVQGAYVSPADERDWIEHQGNFSWTSPQNIQALTTFQKWGKDGYFNSDYNAIKNDASAEEFAKGNGVFWIGGNWDSGIIKKGLGNNVVVMNMPPGPSGQVAAVGSTSGPWHISAKTKYADVAAAWLNYIIGSTTAQNLMYGQQQIPAITGAVPAPSSDPYLGQVASSWNDVQSKGGLMLYTDWASPTMYNTLAANFQKLMAGQETPTQMAQAVQGDWTKFNATLK